MIVNLYFLFFQNSRFLVAQTKEVSFQISSDDLTILAGTWYVAPEQRSSQKVYFKSTDGHFGKWDLSLKRLNLSVLPLLSKSGGLTIIDTTRRGKRFPDALAKTIPIWCAVLNAVAFDKAPKLPYIPPNIVSVQEIDQINQKLESLVEKLKSSKVDTEEQVRKWIKKPLRPIFIHQTSPMFLNCKENELFWDREKVDELDFTPIICVSASKSIAQSDQGQDGIPIIPLDTSFQYVQGAADDSELWCPGLKEYHFWKLEEILDNTISLHDLLYQIDEIMTNSTNQEIDDQKNDFHWIIDQKIAIGNHRAALPPSSWRNFDFIINCGAPKHNYTPNESEKYLYLDIPEGKKGQKQLFDSFQPMLDIVAPIYHRENQNRILFHCMQGLDRSVAMCMALLLNDYPKGSVTKLDVMALLVKIQSFRSQASPSRASMKKIHLFFVREKEE